MLNIASGSLALSEAAISVDERGLLVRARIVSS